MPPAHEMEGDAIGAVLVIGASGLLGRQIAAYLRRAGYLTVGTAQRRVGATDLALDMALPGAAEALLQSLRPRFVLIVAGEKRTDVCERDPARAWALNVDAPGRIARTAAMLGARVLYISTDYVFDGTRPPYFPQSTTHPLNAYGRSKREGESAVLAAGHGMAVLRLPLLFGPGDLSESSVTAVLAQDHGGAQIAADDWAIRYPTFTCDVGAVCLQIVERWAAGAVLDGIHHWSASVPCTKYALSVRLAHWAGLPPGLFVPTQPDKDAVARPRDCHLDVTSLRDLGIGVETPLDRALQAVLKPHAPALARLAKAYAAKPRG
jgi:dTDP-4-dehydrorhamnose reductase